MIYVLITEHKGYYQLSLKDDDNKIISELGDTFCLKDAVRIANEGYIKNSVIGLKIELLSK